MPSVFEQAYAMSTDQADMPIPVPEPPKPDPGGSGSSFFSQNPKDFKSFFGPDAPGNNIPLQPEPPAAPEDPRMVAAQRLEEQSQEALRGSREYIGRAQQAMDEESDVFRRREEALAPIRERQLAQLSRPLPERPKFQSTPPAPARNDPRSDESWLMASGLLGALAGALTRRHVTNALAAFSGAVQGYQEGSQVKFDQSMKVWEAEHKRAVEQNTQALNEYRMILEDRKLSDEQINTYLQITAEKYQDQAMMTAARTKNAINIAQLYDKQFQALEQLKASGQKLNQQWKIDQAERIFQQSRPMIESMLQYKTEPPPRTPRDTVRGMADSMIWAELYNRNPNFDPFRAGINRRVETQEALIPSRVEGAGLSAAERVGQVRATNLEAAARSAGPAIDLAAQYASRVPATRFPKVNELLQTAETAIGDPNLRAFKAANLELARLLARVVNPSSSTITNYQAQAAADLFLTADSPAAYQASLEFAKSFIEREYRAAQEQKRHAPLAPINLPDTTNRPGLGGAAKTIIGGAGEGALEAAGDVARTGADLATTNYNPFLEKRMEQMRQQVAPYVPDIPGLWRRFQEGGGTVKQVEP